MTRDGYRYHARKLRKNACETCGSTKRLCAHHIDRDWKNNDPSNLMTLCNSCHTSLHHAAGEIVTKKEKSPCKHCEKTSYRQGMCNTHLTRLKRYGNPLMIRQRIGSSWQLVWAETGQLVQ